LLLLLQQQRELWSFKGPLPVVLRQAIISRQKWPKQFQYAVAFRWTTLTSKCDLRIVFTLQKNVLFWYIAVIELALPKPCKESVFGEHGLAIRGSLSIA
jgi:hypothetical protein